MLAMLAALMAVPGMASGDGNTPSPLGAPLVVPGVQSLDGAQQTQDQLTAVLDNPEAQQALEASRTEFEGLSGGQAVELAGQTFPQLSGSVEDGLPPLARGERVTGYPSEDSAAVELAGGKHGVIASSEPVATPDGSGDLVGVDLGLQEAGGGFEPVQPAAEVRFAKQAEVGGSLLRTGVSLAPVGSGDGPEGVLDGAAVFYAGTGLDVDTTAKPTGRGFELDSLLRSVRSPQELAFEVGLPAGAALRQEPEGSIAVVAEGAVLATIAPPRAVDANGTPVPVSMTISAGEITLTIDHLAGRYRYPIEVDPTIQESSGPSGWLLTRAWGWYATDPSNFAARDVEEAGSDYVEDYNVGTIPVGQSAFYYYKTQGESRIWGLVAKTESTSAEAQMENAIGIENVHGAGFEARQAWVGSYSAEATVCANAGCAPGSVNSSNDESEAFFSQGSRETAYSFTSKMRAAYVELLQEAAPTAGFDTTDERLAGGQFNDLYGGGRWVNSKESGYDDAVFEARDPGLGISEFGYVARGVSGWGDPPSKILTGCTGVQCSECWSPTCGAPPSFFSLHSLPEGEFVLEASVGDPAGLKGTGTAVAKIDNAAPTGIVLSGLPPGNEIGYGLYRLKAKATDGAGSTPSSGVASMTLSVDGVQVGKPLGYCSPGPCSASAEWAIQGEEYAPGKHTLVVAATDGAGNVAKETYTLTIHAAESASVGPGSVELDSGAFRLSSTDVNVASPGASLTVQRSFNSRLAGTDIEGPFGPQWSGLSLAGSEALSKLPTGSVVLTAASGGQSMFPKEGSKFASPPGDKDLTLTEESSTKYTLTDQSGDVTVFTVPAGGSGEVLTPSLRQQAGATGSVTYSYQTTKAGVTEPTQALAPVAAGVKCATLVKGCRALSFSYASSTTAGGEAPGEWGEYAGRIVKVSFTAWDPVKKEMTTTAVAQYSYDKQGRLRAEWDPRISPALKTTYGYDAEGHITSLQAPGQQPWLFTYGIGASDSHGGRLLTVVRPSAATAFGSGSAPSSTTAPTLSATPTIGTELTVSTGSWSNSPLTYSYQWEQCKKTECTPILGATNRGYTPGYFLEGASVRAVVTATNAAGSASVFSEISKEIPVVVPVPTYSLQIGAVGKESKSGGGPGELSGPSYAALGGHESELFVTDTLHHRVEVYNSASGEYLRKFGEANLTQPTGIVMMSGRVDVADAATSQIDVFSVSGTLEEVVKAAGKIAGLAYDENISLFAADATSSTIDKFKEGTGKLEPSGTLPASDKAKQASGPAGLAWCHEDVYIADSLVGKISRTTYEELPITALAFTGKGNGTFLDPQGIACDKAGDVWIADAGNERVQELTGTGSYVLQFGSEGSTEGHFMTPVGVVANAAGEIYVVDSANNRVQKFQPGKHPAEIPVPPAVPQNPGASAVTTIDYEVPVSGAGAPYALGSSEAAAWAQKDDPVKGTAIYPPDEPMGWPARDYKRATVYYLDGRDRTVNTAAPGGAISTTEYSTGNDVVRSLTADNRALALKEGSKSAEASQLLDTQSTYNTEGTELQSTLGPQHTVKLASGSQVEARSHTLYSYDEGAPETGGPYRLATKITQGALPAGGKEETDVRTTSNSYAGQENLGWKLRKPTTVTTDPAGLKLTHTTLYEAATGDVSEARMPKSSGAESPHDEKTIYYSTEANKTYPGCGEHPEWANLPCQTQPAKQPETSGLPNLPVSTVTYNIWDEPERTTETVGSTTRTKTATYDAAGRLKTTAISSTVGTALPTVTDEYNTETGALASQSTTIEGKTRKLSSIQNTLGETTSYTDADENTSTYTYDIDGRPETVDDGKGTQTYSYDETTGALKTLKDTGAGTFTAAYDTEGILTSEGYPNGMNANYTFNPAGQATNLEYVKTTHCTENCVWFKDSVVPSIHGQWLSQTSSLSTQAYSYDSSGRLTQVQDTPAGKGCTTRVYSYDADTNRTSLTTREPGTKGECTSTGGKEEKHTYDEADRLLDTGVGYDTWGNTTKLPAADAGGSELVSSFYTDDQLASQTQNGTTDGYQLDPAGRPRETTITGKGVESVISHYSGSGGEPTWTSNSSAEWTRDTPGINGQLAAVQSNGETPVLQLGNLHGDIVATAADSETATGLASSADTGEYGVPTTSLPPKYSWLGALQIPTELPSGVTTMGVRSYVPQLGRFLQDDPISGGSANAYAYTYGDPVNTSDPSGAYTIGGPSAALIGSISQASAEGAAEQAAINGAARAEAERKAHEAENAAGTSMDSEGPEEEWEEWWEEEEEVGGYEYITGHQGSETGEEHRTESAILVQPLNEEAEGSFGEHQEVKGGPGVCGMSGGHHCKAHKIWSHAGSTGPSIEQEADKVWHEVKCGVMSIGQLEAEQTTIGSAMKEHGELKPRNC